MSILAYITLGLVVLMALLAYLANPELKTVLTLLPMVLVLGGIPLSSEKRHRRTGADSRYRTFRDQQMA